MMVIIIMPIILTLKIVLSISFSVSELKVNFSLDSEVGHISEVTKSNGNAL